MLLELGNEGLGVEDNILSLIAHAKSYACPWLQALRHRPSHNQPDHGHSSELHPKPLKQTDSTASLHPGQGTSAPASISTFGLLG